MQAFSLWIPLAENSKSKILIKFDLFLYDNGMLYSTFLIKLDETKRPALEVNKKADLVIIECKQYFILFEKEYLLCSCLC